MSNPLSPTEDPDFYSSILENLKQLSAQLGTPLDEASVMEIYQNACDLLNHVSLESMAGIMPRTSLLIRVDAPVTRRHLS